MKRKAAGLSRTKMSSDREKEGNVNSTARNTRVNHVEEGGSNVKSPVTIDPSLIGGKLSYAGAVKGE